MEPSENITVMQLQRCVALLKEKLRISRDGEMASMQQASYNNARRLHLEKQNQMLNSRNIELCRFALHAMWKYLQAEARRLELEMEICGERECDLRHRNEFLVWSATWKRFWKEYKSQCVRTRDGWFRKRT